MAEQVADSDGVYLVPAFVGWARRTGVQKARPLTGLTRGSGPARWRATLESIAYQVRDVFVAMQGDAGIELEFL